MRFDRKRALVTGAGKGIGRAIAKTLAKYGAETFALSRTQADLDSLISEVPNIKVINVDLQDWDKTKEEVSKIGHIDLLVNNAGTFNVSQIIAKRMIENGKGGSIVNISSIMSETAAPDGCVYSTTKAAIDMLTKCMALELGPHNIRVNSINPTVVWTDMARSIKDHLMPLLPMTPLGRFAEIADVVNAVVFLLSDQSGMISGECLRVDGGLGVH
ncbi:DCXR [Mytilus coruscus]|uniref:DCXR n=1 Tax=Mytilus coruscus TaxID=42192 RepID=A0A6J8EIX3_MYTCO|nr:DCXR [Mytilus coruscus]